MFKVAFPLISNIRQSTCRTLDLSSQSELTECFMSMYAHSDCENLSCPYDMCFYELTILWCFIWSHHTSSSNRDVEILFENSNVWLRWGQSSKYTKAHHVSMWSKHTTPGNRLYYDFTNGTVMTLWRHKCIAYSFVFLVFGEQVCCQLITCILLCLFPECEAKATCQLGPHANQPTDISTCYVCNHSAVNTLHIV